jgi:hypothetical protein
MFVVKVWADEVEYEASKTVQQLAMEAEARR